MTGKNFLLNTKKLLVIYVLLLCFSFDCFSQTNVLLSSNQKTISPGDIFSVQVIIEGETDAEIASVENLNFFNIEGQSTSSSFKFINELAPWFFWKLRLVNYFDNYHHATSHMACDGKRHSSNEKNE